MISKQLLVPDSCSTRATGAESAASSQPGADRLDAGLTGTSALVKRRTPRHGR
jgi:hypothetical protein